MTQPDNTERPYGDDNPIPLTVIALEVAKEFDVRITPISESAFSFQATDYREGPFYVFVVSSGDQVSMNLPAYNSNPLELGDSETVSSRSEAVRYLSDVFDQMQDESNPGWPQSEDSEDVTETPQPLADTEPTVNRESKKPEWLTRILTRSDHYQLDLAGVFLFAAIFVAVPYYALSAFSLVPLHGVWYDSMQIVGWLLLASSVFYMWRWTGAD